MTQSHDLNAVEAAFEGRRKNRIVHWFDIPVVLANDTGIKKVGLVELFSGEEIAASKRSRGGMQDLETAYELAKESLRYVDDRPLNTADGSVDAFWGGNLPGLTFIRQLVLAGYAKIHNPKAVDVRDFLGSQSSEAR